MCTELRSGIVRTGDQPLTIEFHFIEGCTSKKSGTHETPVIAIVNIPYEDKERIVALRGFVATPDQCGYIKRLAFCPELLLCRL